MPSYPIYILTDATSFDFAYFFLANNFSAYLLGLIAVGEVPIHNQVNCLPACGKPRHGGEDERENKPLMRTDLQVVKRFTREWLSMRLAEACDYSTAHLSLLGSSKVPLHVELKLLEIQEKDRSERHP